MKIAGLIFALSMMVGSMAQALDCTAERGTRGPGERNGDIVSYSFDKKAIDISEEVTFDGDYMIQVKPSGSNAALMVIHRYIGGNLTERGSTSAVLPASLTVDIEGGYIHLRCE